MSFTPVIPVGGLAGWRFLQRTMERQEQSLANSPTAQRDEAYFRDRVSHVESAAELVADRRLLSVALTAFGLSDDLPNRAFIQRVLESDVDDRRSFANRLADKRYAELARTFGFGSEEGNRLSEAKEIEALLGRARAMRFEIAVGEQDNSFRLALALQRDLKTIAEESGSDDAGWYRVPGSPSLREVFETAFNLPREFAGLDLERQVEILRSRTLRLTGSTEIAQFSDPSALEDLTRRYFVGVQINQVQFSSPTSIALTLLQSAGSFARGR